VKRCQVPDSTFRQRIGSSSISGAVLLPREIRDEGAEIVGIPENTFKPCLFYARTEKLAGVSDGT